LLNSLLVLGSLQAAGAIQIEAGLSFFGAGVPPPAPSWGSMIADGRQYALTAWWLTAIPGVAIAGLVLALNLLGDILRDALDPTLRGR
jgi:peptide/nickel transport system permease protein